MITPSSSADCLVVGAGLAGLIAARELTAAGVQTVVVEKEMTAGGRMATQQLPTYRGVAVADTGAQYFTVRDELFGRMVNAWQTSGWVRQWSKGFVAPDSSGYFDGHPRYSGASGMASIAGYLGETVAIRPASEVTNIWHQSAWQVELADGERLEANALLLTPPVPQSLALLAKSGASLAADDAVFLARMAYDPCLAVLAVLAGPSRIPPPGGLWPGGARSYWIADNQQKGISTLPAVTIHASPEYSRARWEADSETIIAELTAEAEPWLGSAVVSTALRRWRYSIPMQLYPARTLSLEHPGPLALAGDAFAGPRVEGAALSGMAAAKALLTALSR